MSMQKSFINCLQCKNSNQALSAELTCGGRLLEEGLWCIAYEQLLLRPAQPAGKGWTVHQLTQVNTAVQQQ